MARLLPQVQGMTHAQDEENVYVTFYAAHQPRPTLLNFSHFNPKDELS